MACEASVLPLATVATEATLAWSNPEWGIADATALSIGPSCARTSGTLRRVRVGCWVR